MDNGLNKKKKKAKHPDRVTLTPEHQEKVDGWIKQVTANHRGVRLTRNNVVDWLIGSYAAELSRSDEKALAERFYDEERFLREAMRELRSRKARGESISLMELLRNVDTGKSTPKNRPRKVKARDAAIEPSAENL